MDRSFLWLLAVCLLAGPAVSCGEKVASPPSEGDAGLWQVGISPSELSPRDEAVEVPDLLEFRTWLLGRIAARDAEALLGVVDQKVLVSFGGDGGLGEFVEAWNPEDPGSDLWTELETILGLGGVLSKDREGRISFDAPYLAKSPVGVDPFDGWGWLVDEGVPLIATPEPAGEVLAYLSYELVRAVNSVSRADRPVVEDPEGWTLIEIPDGRRGYVPAESFRSPIDYRLRLTRKRQGWRMTYLIAGD